MRVSVRLRSSRTHTSFVLPSEFRHLPSIQGRIKIVRACLELSRYVPEPCYARDTSFPIDSAASSYFALLPSQASRLVRVGLGMLNIWERVEVLTDGADLALHSAWSFCFETTGDGGPECAAKYASVGATGERIRPSCG